MAHSKCGDTLWIKYDGTAIVGEEDITSDAVAYGGYYYKKPSTTQYCNLYTRKIHNHGTDPNGDYHLTDEEYALYGSLTYSSYWVTNYYNEVYTTITALNGKNSNPNTSPYETFIHLNGTQVTSHCGTATYTFTPTEDCTIGINFGIEPV